MALPTSARREEITGRFADLITALESHPQWTPPNVDRGLFHVWDFVKRSHYIMTELENIEAGRPVQHPEQIPKNNGVETGPQAAAASYKDVCTRTLTINEMIQNPRMMVMLGLSNVDFGTDIQERSTLVKEALFSTK
ncbi:uncharacterized protein FTOL_08125 [Fusarium torulosum]|uniref:Uncharacterized protein n=1 Tax=Fusarium torulosum TaxID=33205 RepID=A0AAE8SJN7_9HYPO|nr:uncharacterized protein FTOL_08125 [Fusarium torulosum]